VGETTQVNFIIDEEVLREIDAAAELADMSRSEFFRKAAKEKASATSPKEIEAKIDELDAKAKEHEKKAQEHERKKKELQRQLEEFGDAQEQYNEAVRDLANGIAKGEEAKSLLEDASAPRIRKIAGIAEVEPQQVIRDLKNELAVESPDELRHVDRSEEVPFSNAGKKADVSRGDSDD